MRTPQRVELSQRLQRQGLPAASVGDIVRNLRENRDSSPFADLVVERAVPLDDIKIRKDGKGRTVDAYAAVFMTPTEIVDGDGHYKEQNHPNAFNNSLAQRRDSIFCIYNHGRTLQGSPSDLYSVPIGVPTLTADGRATPLADNRGLLTSTVYNSDPESDRILEAIRSGSLKGMSYTGVFVRSEPPLRGPRDFYEPDQDGQLILVTRMEIALIEYGPTPIPAYDTAQIVGVRSRESITLLGRSQTMIHHTPINYSSTWDEDEALDAMTFPANQDDMNNMFAYYDERAAGADPDDGAGGSFPRYSGYLPHHDVVNGKPGPANTAAISQCLARLDTLPDNYYGASKEGVRNHLLAHQSDEDPGKTGVNPSSGQGEGDPEKIPPTGSSGRKPDGSVRAQAMTHEPMAGSHSHQHNAYNGPDPDGDGIHEHPHHHSNDNEHGHDHDGTVGPASVLVSSSGRNPDGSPRAMAQGDQVWDPDDDGDNDMTAAGDTDHDYWDADGHQLHSVPGKPLGLTHPAITVQQHHHAHDAHGGEDADGDGVHSHPHDHSADGVHDHHHDGHDGHHHAGAGVGGMSTPHGGDVPHANIVGSSGRGPEATHRQYEAWADAYARADNKKPYGNVEYADPKNGKYPIDAEHVEAAWSYINQAKNAAKYPLNGVTLAEVKAKIKAAMKKHGHKVDGDDGDGGGKPGSSGNNGSSSSGRQPAASALARSNGNSAEPHMHPAPTSARESGMSHSDTIRMTVGERMERQSAIRARLGEIDSEYMGAELPSETRTEWRQLQEELVIHQRAVKDAEERAHYLQMISESSDHTEGIDNGAAGYGANGGGNEYGSGYVGSPAARSGIAGMRGTAGPAFRQDLGDAIYDLTAIRNRARNFDEVPSLYREYAMRAVERSRFPTPEKSREDCQGTIERLLLNVDDEQGTLSRRILVTGSPLYDRAFGKALSAMSTGGLTSEESRALQLGVDSAGGFAVPFQLDPTVLLTSNGAINPLRQISRVEQIVGKEWDGVTSAGVTVTRVAEGTEAASADASFVQPKVRTTRVQGFVPFNIELDVSWGALRSQMTSLLMDAKDVEEATSFSMGNGTAPNAQGVVQYAHDNAFTVSTAGTATLAIADLYSLENNMAPRFRQQSSYLASKTTFNRFRQLFQAQASAAFDSWVRPSAGTPATFNGYPAYEQSQMGTTITSGSFIILQGDYSKFLIVDRVGMGIELIPHLFGPTNRYPLGQRGILAIWFNNSQVLVGNAFRLLVTT